MNIERLKPLQCETRRLEYNILDWKMAKEVMSMEQETESLQQEQMGRTNAVA